MTPPDSGARTEPTPCKHGCLGPCAYCMTGAEPGSGAREVIHAQGCQSFYGEPCDCIETPAVSIPLPLAQRILAALELTHEAHCVSLASELRERMPK